MNPDELRRQVFEFSDRDIPLPGGGETSRRHRLLFEAGKRGLSLARLVEAHWDALAILAEANLQPQPGVLYGVWASERPGQPVAFEKMGDSFVIRGSKGFCSGAGIVDRALITTLLPEARLVDMDLRSNREHLVFDTSAWKTASFRDTNTATVTFNEASFQQSNFVGPVNWYLERSGFWHGACGPAACWGGGAAGLLEYAFKQSRNDAHTLAHIGAMFAGVWAIESYLKKSGDEIDESPTDGSHAITRALTLRHLTEQACTDILRRLTRAFGPHPLVADQATSQRYEELDIYLRQSHAERDLEALGTAVRQGRFQGI